MTRGHIAGCELRRPSSIAVSTMSYGKAGTCSLQYQNGQTTYLEICIVGINWRVLVKKVRQWILEPNNIQVLEEEVYSRHANQMGAHNLLHY